MEGGSLANFGNEWPQMASATTLGLEEGLMGTYEWMKLMINKDRRKKGK